ncbi:hypothetical protein [Sporolactobacillus terrae]|uniref:hypothetical protein n=1 Tax=Sporolactobacillus terrae TaxID=269673 RepID=UPI000B2389A4|nr:hypothetical protein [Sporolactobacillus terrae]
MITIDRVRHLKQKPCIHVTYHYSAAVCRSVNMREKSAAVCRVKWKQRGSPETTKSALVRQPDRQT